MTLHNRGVFMPRTKMRVAILATAVGLAAALVPSPASAGACGAGGNYFDGFYYNPNDVGHLMRGSHATIVARPSTQCTGSENFSTSWTMWEGGTTGLQYVQAGFMKITSHGFTEVFSEYNNGTGHTRYYSGVQAVDGSTAVFETRWSFNSVACPSTTNCASTYKGNTLLQRTPFDPTNWPSPYYNEVFGETSNVEANVPGSPSSPTTFSAIKYINGNNAHVSQPCGMTARLDIPSRWAQDTPACDQRRVWTK